MTIITLNFHPPNSIVNSNHHWTVEVAAPQRNVFWLHRPTVPLCPPWLDSVLFLLLFACFFFGFFPSICEMIVFIQELVYHVLLCCWPHYSPVLDHSCSVKLTEYRVERRNKSIALEEWAEVAVVIIVVSFSILCSHQMQAYILECSGSSHSPRSFSFLPLLILHLFSNLWTVPFL